MIRNKRNASFRFPNEISKILSQSNFCLRFPKHIPVLTDQLELKSHSFSSSKNVFVSCHYYAFIKITLVCFAKYKTFTMYIILSQSKIFYWFIILNLPKKVTKKFVKLCLHLSYIAQNSLHFDKIFFKSSNFSQKKKKIESKDLSFTLQKPNSK